jgi:hypothetical protein
MVVAEMRAARAAGHLRHRPFIRIKCWTAQALTIWTFSQSRIDLGLQESFVLIQRFLVVSQNPLHLLASGGSWLGWALAQPTATIRSANRTIQLEDAALLDATPEEVGGTLFTTTMIINLAATEV